MFTGIVEELGRVAGLVDARLTVDCEVAVLDSPVGASVAVSGVCLTVVEQADAWLTFDLTARMGGHMVQGHVDGVGTVTRVEQQEGGATLWIGLSEGLERYVVEKGSITVDGVSLTITGVDADGFGVALIPHTLAVTTLGSVRAGDRVNLEVDVLAKYVERLLGMANGNQERGEG